MGKRVPSEEAAAGRRNRNATNLYTLLGTCALMFALVGISNGEIMATGIKKMAFDINRALMNVLTDMENIEYEEYRPRDDYNSSTAYNSKGMGVLYNITNVFIKSLIPEPLPIELLVIKDGQPTIKDDDYLAVAKHYVAFLVFLSFLLVFALLMPLCGFCFCCCRCCCGNCGAKTKPFDKKGDLCKKVLHASLLIVLGTLFLFGVVCAFVTNQQMQEGTNELVDNLQTSVSDASAYFDDTSQHSEHLLKNNFKKFSDNVKLTLQESSNILFLKLKDITKASYIDDALELAEKIEPVKKKLVDLKSLTNKLRVQASQLNDATRKIKKDLLDTLSACYGVNECTELMAKYVNNLGTNIDFNKIPDVSSALDAIGSLDGEIVASIEEGKKELEELEVKIETEVKTNVDNALTAIDDAGDHINTESDKFLKVFREMNEKMKKMSKDGLKTTDNYIKDYSKYRYYIGLGVSCVLLLICLCVAFGLICGICGKRPDSYNDDCCNKGAGNTFLIFGVGIMFLTAFILVVVLLVHIIAMFVHLLVCEPIRDPENSKVLTFLDDMGKLEDIMWPGVTFVSVLNNCYKNQSAYKVFNLKEKFDVNDIKTYIDEFNINKTMDDFKTSLKEIKFDDIDLNVADSVLKLEELKNSGLSEINFGKFKEELEESFTTVDLDEFRNRLNELIEKLNNTPGVPKAVVNDLALIHLHIGAYIEKLFTPMTENAKKVMNTSSDIVAMLGSESEFEKTIDDLITNLNAAEEALKLTGAEELIKITDKFASNITGQIDHFVNHTISNVENKVGNCGPFALIIKGTMTSTCDKILQPMNGFWFSIFWCLVLFIPTIIVSVKLGSLYKKSDSFPGSFAESEYLYDAYANRENIPLARGKNAKKKKKSRSTGGERYADTYDPGHRNYPGASHHPDARYADMAPKHFEDYPNGGPPQYQRATEYERPPPYYYPGSGDQN